MGSATTIPTASRIPMLVPKNPAAVTGPGCGGRNTCMTENAPIEGSA